MSKKNDVERLRESLGRIIDHVEAAFLNMDSDEQFLLGGHRLADMLRARLGLSQMGAGWQREYHPGPVQEPTFVVKEMRVGAWSPDPEIPYTQIHLILNISCFPHHLMVRLTGPSAVNDLIKELARLRDHVWPEAKGGVVVRENTNE